LRPRVPRRESQKECAGNQRQRCRCSPDELACRKHWQSLALFAHGDTIGLKSWQKSIGHANFGRRGCGFRRSCSARVSAPEFAILEDALDVPFD
jgi:hypothetical protein